jgi:hypothetical protein
MEKTNSAKIHVIKKKMERKKKYLMDLPNLKEQ